MKKILFYSSIILILSTACKKQLSSLIIKNLKVEYSSAPIGVDVASPRFSWQLEDTVRGTVQNQYKIIVASERHLLSDKKADIWNSGWIVSDQNCFVDYKGKSLLSGKEYFWTVIVVDNFGRQREPENPSHFSMAKLNKEDWQAKWIAFQPDESYNTPSGRPRSVMLREDFTITKKIKKAKVYVSGLGNYVLFLNGKKVGNDLLTPGWTDYHKRVQYQIYNVEDYIFKGENAAGIILGNMWWSGGLGWEGGAIYSEGPLRTIMQLEVEYSDGSREIINTDENWKAHVSAITDNTLYHGEIYNANLEIDDWSLPGSDETKWSAVSVLKMDSVILSAQKGPEIRVADEIVPVTLTEVKPGIYVFDMGINMVGTERISFKGNKGDTIILRFAELLHEDGTVAQENLRSARATDMYILSEDGEFKWEPHFTYHGYRYVQVEGLSEKPLKEDFTGLRFYSSAPVSGNFECSNAMINSVWTNIVNGQKGNMHSVPTDCPQRDERLGWMGDAQIFAATACYNMDMNQFFAKWMQDITDSQDKEGYVYDVNPAIVVEGPSKAGWGDAVTIVPWTLYKFYGDQKVLVDNYAGMKAWVEYMRKKSVDNIYEWKQKDEIWEGYGDWIAVEKSPVEPISAAYYYYSTRILADVAFLLGNNDDYAEYNQLAEKISEAFNKRFFDAKLINYPSGTQTANLIPIAFSLVPGNYFQNVVKNVADDVLKKGKHPTTGFLGTVYLLPVLSDNGYHQLAYETAINEDYPSWGYMVKNGATSMWELWNSDTEKPEGMNSRNHFALGSVGEWYYSHLAGIKPAQPGFKEIYISPMPAEGLDWVKAEIESPYGKIKSDWQKTENSLDFQISIPANSSAIVTLPVSYFTDSQKSYSVTERGKTLEAGQDLLPEGIISVQEDVGSIILNVQSGNYSFKIEGKH